MGPRSGEMEIRHRLGKAIVPLLLVVGVLYVVHLADWEDVTTTRRGRVLTFEIGMDKLAAFQAARDAQQRSLIESLVFVEEPPRSVGMLNRSGPIEEPDFDRASRSDEWHVGVVDQNAWLLLLFDDDELSRIERHTWTGPTK